MKVVKQEAVNIYRDAIKLLLDSECDFLIGGGFAVVHYTGIYRDTKDLDIFCKASDYPKILKCFANHGYRTELTDVRWLAKVFKEDSFIDIIFDTVNNICRVDDVWFTNAQSGEFCGLEVKFIPPEELVWCKIYVQNRERNDSADINHLLLKCGRALNWRRLFERLDAHWHLLLAQLIVFQFVYPSEYRYIIPEWLFDDLLARAKEQYELPPPLEKVCRGPLIDQTQYAIDIKDWDYKACTIKTI